MIKHQTISGMMYILTTDCHDEGEMGQIQLSQDQNIQHSSPTVISWPRGVAISNLLKAYFVFN